MFLKRVYSEICVIRVQIFILVSLLCEFVTFRRKKDLTEKNSVVIYEQIRFCEIKSNLNPHIRDLRKKKGITQEQLSIMLNVSANHLAKVETGSRCCSIELLQDLSSCLNVRTDYLLNGDAPHNNHLRERLTFLAQELEKITADLPVWG